MEIVRLDLSRIISWDSFHDVFASTFGFPEYYGRNMDAWIDCMTYLDEPDTGMAKISVKPGEVVTLLLEGVGDFAARCPAQYAALMDCSAFVNWRRIETGDPPVLALAHQDRTDRPREQTRS